MTIPLNPAVFAEILVDATDAAAPILEDDDVELPEHIRNGWSALYLADANAALSALEDLLVADCKQLYPLIIATEIFRIAAGIDRPDLDGADPKDDWPQGAPRLEVVKSSRRRC